MNSHQNQSNMSSPQISQNCYRTYYPYQNYMETHIFQSFVLNCIIPNCSNCNQQQQTITQFAINLPLKDIIKEKLSSCSSQDKDEGKSPNEDFSMIMRDTFRLYLIVKYIPNQISHYQLLTKISEVCNLRELDNSIQIQIARCLTGLTSPYENCNKSIISQLFRGELEQQQKLFLTELLGFSQIKKAMTVQFIKAYNQNINFFQSAWYKEFSKILLTDFSIIQQLAEKDIFLLPKMVDNTFWDIFHNYIITSEKMPKKLISKMLTTGAILDNYDKFNTLIPEILKSFKQDKQILKSVILNLINNVDQSANLSSKLSPIFFCKSKLPVLTASIILLRKGQASSLRDFQQLIQFLQLDKSKLQAYLQIGFQQTLYYIIKSEENFQNQARVYMQILVFMSCKLDNRAKHSIWQLSWQKIQKSQLLSKLSNVNLHLIFITILSEFVNCILDIYSLLSLTNNLDISSEQLKNKQKAALEQIVATEEKLSPERVKSIVNWLGNFQNAGSIFRSMVTYNPKESKFVYNGNLNKDPKIRTLFSTGQIVIAGQYLRLNQNQIYLRDFLLADDFIDIFYKSFRKVHDPQEILFIKKRQKFMELSYYMLVALYNIFSGQKGKINHIVAQIHMALSKEHQQNQISQLLNHCPAVKTKLKAWFAQNQRNQNSNHQQEKERKQKMAEIKRRKFQQMKEKQKRATLVRATEMNQEKENQIDTQLCIICHEAAKVKDLLYAFCCVSQNYVVQNLLQTDYPQSHIHTCFHLIHESCFSEKFSQIRFYACPLCRSVFNCIIPHKIEQKSAAYIMDKNSYWRLRVQALLALYSNENSCSSYEFLFNYLIFSQVILSKLTNCREQSKRQKITQVVYNIMINGYKMKEFDVLYLKKTFNSLLNTKYIEISQLKRRAIHDAVRHISKELTQMNYEQMLNFSLSMQADASKKLQNQMKRQENLSQSIQSLMHFIELPLDAEQFYSHSKSMCSKCHINPILWQCLICKLKSCIYCQNLVVHITDTHHYMKGGKALILDFQTCSVHILSRNQKIIKNCLFTNEFQQKWNANLANHKSFKLKQNLLEQIYNIVLKDEMDWSNIYTASGLWR